MTARDIWKQCYRYQRMTQDMDSWQNDILDKALDRMPSPALPPKPVDLSGWQAHAYGAGQLIAHRQNLLLRRMNVRMASVHREMFGAMKDEMKSTDFWAFKEETS